MTNNIGQKIRRGEQKNNSESNNITSKATYCALHSLKSPNS